MGILKSFIGFLSGWSDEQVDDRSKRQSYIEKKNNYNQPNEEFQPDMCAHGYCKYFVPYLSERRCSMCNYRIINTADGKSFVCQKDFSVFMDENARCRLSGCSRQNYEPVYSKSPVANNCPLPPKR